jgi:hypothetical protein
MEKGHFATVVAKGRNVSQKEEAGSLFREWNDFPQQAVRWTLNRV